VREQSSAEGGRVGGRPPLDLALPPRRRSPRAQSGRQGGPRTSKGGCDGHHREGATHRQAENSRSWAGRIESGARYLDPSFTVLAFAAGLVSFVGWGMETGWTWGMETVRSGRPR